MTTAHDRIELEERIGASVDDAWTLISEPGWFINEGSLVEHVINWTDARTAVVTDSDHGEFTFLLENTRPPERIVWRGLGPEGAGDARTVTFEIVAEDAEVLVRVVEAGFADMAVPVADQVAQFEQNTRTWRHQLRLAKDELEGRTS